MFRGFLEYIGLATPAEQESLADDTQIDAEYVDIPSATAEVVATTTPPISELQTSTAVPPLATIQTTQQRPVEAAENTHVIKLALATELRKKRRQFTGLDTPRPMTATEMPKPADMKGVMAEIALKHAAMLRRNAQFKSRATEVEPTFSIEPDAFDHTESAQNIVHLAKHRPQSDISAEEKLFSLSDKIVTRSNPYQRLNSEDFMEDFTNEDLMLDSLDAVETASPEEKAANIVTIEELINYYNAVSPEFDKLKERFQNMSLLQSAEQTTILFPTLQQYQPVSPALNFRQMNNPTYLSQKSQNLATNFNNYIAFNLPKIKMHRSMIEKNQMDDARIERAYSAGFECAEQMRRTSYSVADLLEKAETFNNDMHTVNNATTSTLGTMIRKLNDARHELNQLHIALYDYQIKKQYGPNNTEVERKRLLAPAFR